MDCTRWADSKESAVDRGHQHRLLCRENHPAEVASELLNSARARIFAQADALAAVDRVAAQRLVEHAAELKRLQNTLSAAAPERSQQVIGRWGPLLRDEQAFWSELMEPVAA